jgi:hypothetical protein
MINFTRKELKLIKFALGSKASSWMSQTESEKNQVYRDIATKIEDYLGSTDGVKDATKEIKANATKLPNKKMKLEDTMEFNNYLEEKENDQIDKELNEDVGAFIGKALGYGATGLAGAFGGTLLVLGGVQAVKGLVGLWKRITKNVKGIFKPATVVREMKTDARVQKVSQEMKQTKGKYEDELKYVYLAITNKDFTQAREELEKLPSTIQNSPDVHKSIITEITKSLKMPPIYIASPGNKSYQAIKKVINIRIARAAAAATKLAFEGAIGGE